MRTNFSSLVVPPPQVGCVLLLVATGCRPKYEIAPIETGTLDTAPADTSPGDTGVPDTAGGDTGEATVPPDDTANDALWDATSLKILSPQSGTFISLGTSSAFEAHVYDGEGDEMDFDDISWTSDRDSDWLPVGTDFEDATLGAGKHVLTATARLPNGDRLAYAVGDVLVQSEYAGTYTGTLTLELTVSYGGTDYAVGGAGGATLVVEPEGIAVTGTSTCVVDLMGYSMEMEIDVDMQNTAGALDGTAAADLYILTYDFDATGTLTEDGELELGFAEDIMGYALVEGAITATRISRDTELE